MGEGLGQGSFWRDLVGIYVYVLPMFFAGLEGQPVDIYKYFAGTGLAGYNLVASIAAFVLAIGILLTLVNAVVSIAHGARAGHDPWGGSTLEWFALSPPPPHNFDAVPDVRCAEPLRDIREAIRGATEAGRPPVAARPDRAQPADRDGRGGASPGASEGALGSLTDAVAVAPPRGEPDELARFAAC